MGQDFMYEQSLQEKQKLIILNVIEMKVATADQCISLCKKKSSWESQYIRSKSKESKAYLKVLKQVKLTWRCGTML